MSDFKVGDIVVRVGRSFNEMEPGDTDEIIGFSDGSDGYSSGTLILKNFKGGHSQENFKLVKLPTEGWDYAEADRLQRTVETAIKAYNDYISKKPDKEYTPF